MAKATRKSTKKSTLSIEEQVVAMRDNDELSWATIGDHFGFAPRTARSKYDSIKGEGAHHGLLPGKGGRTPVKVVAKPVKKVAAKKATAKATKKVSGKKAA